MHCLIANILRADLTRLNSIFKGGNCLLSCSLSRTQTQNLVPAKAEAERSLDPLNGNPQNSRALAEAIGFEHKRLMVALPKLHARLHLAEAREHAARWGRNSSPFKMRVTNSPKN